jgi:hypothetical protein
MAVVRSHVGDKIARMRTFSSTFRSIVFCLTVCGLTALLGCEASSEPSESCPEKTKPWMGCLQDLGGGICSDVLSDDAFVCEDGKWRCADGYVGYEKCRCGVPPDRNCLMDAGTDVTRD